jgi:hypothetical protein
VNNETPNALGDIEKEEIENVEEENQISISAAWRVERRNDRNPPGFAIFERGINPRTQKPKYIGYVGYYSKSKKPEGFPTYNQLAAGRG